MIEKKRRKWSTHISIFCMKWVQVCKEFFATIFFKSQGILNTIIWEPHSSVSSVAMPLAWSGLAGYWCSIKPPKWPGCLDIQWLLKIRRRQLGPQERCWPFLRPMTVFCVFCRAKGHLYLFIYYHSGFQRLRLRLSSTREYCFQQLPEIARTNQLQSIFSTLPSKVSPRPGNQGVVSEKARKSIPQQQKSRRFLIRRRTSRGSHPVCHRIRAIHHVTYWHWQISAGRKGGVSNLGQTLSFATVYRRSDFFPSLFTPAGTWMMTNCSGHFVFVLNSSDFPWWLFHELQMIVASPMWPKKQSIFISDKTFDFPHSFRAG